MRQLATAKRYFCGEVAAGSDAAVQLIREAVEDEPMIFHRLATIAVRKYTDEPSNPAPAVKMLLRNAVRLCVLHLGREQAVTLANDALREAGGKAT